MTAPRTAVGRLMDGRVATGLIAAFPVPLRLARVWLVRDNAAENRRGSWGRLREQREAVRYAAVREVTERYARHGFVLDVGCSQGILQEGLRYARYEGVDSYGPALELARARADARTRFVQADGSRYVPDRAPDAVILNEVLYYLPDALGTAEHYASLLAPGGVVVVSVYARSWPTRRLLGQLRRRLHEVESRTVRSGHLAWTVAAFRRPI